MLLSLTPGVPTGVPKSRLLHAAVLLLLLVGGTLLAAYARRQRPANEGPAHAGSPFSHITPSDPRVAGVFASAERDGLGAGLDELERAAAADSAILRSGHQLAHALGRQSFAAGGDESVLGQCRPVFASGCYHGVVEAFVQVRGAIKMGALERMCAAAGSVERPGPIHECVHGLGHGVLGAVGLEVPPALGHCDGLSKPGFVTACHQGVFMEAISQAIVEGPAPEQHVHGEHEAEPRGRFGLDPSNPHAPCDRVSDPYAPSCWLFQGYVILRSVGFDPRAALQACDAAPGGRVALCYESIGHQLTGLLQRDDTWIIERCAEGRPEFAPYCAGGAALALVGMDWAGERAKRFCGMSPGPWKKQCYSAAATMLGAVAAPGRRAALCAAVEPEYRTICRRSLTLEPGA